MPRNVEIKARLTDVTVQRRLAETIAGSGPTILVQEDVFFTVPRGRLKLRCFPDGTAELIAYDRPDQSGPKTSDYSVLAIDHPAALRTLLEKALGLRSVVRKTRELYMAGRTRIHLDRVEGLGDFLELEVVLAPGEDEAGGRREAEALMRRLQVTRESLVEAAYVDLIEAGRRGP